MLKRQLFFTLTISILFSSFSIYGKSDFGFLGRIEFPLDRLPQIITSFINQEGQTLLHHELKKYPLPPFQMGGDLENCQFEKLKEMEVSIAWQKCPGIPEYFLSDTQKGISNFKPRPQLIELQHISLEKLDGVQFEWTSKKEEEDILTVSFKELILKGSFSFKGLLDQKTYWSKTPLLIKIKNDKGKAFLLDMALNLNIETNQLFTKSSFILPDETSIEIFLDKEVTPLDFFQQDYRPYLKEVKSFMRERDFATFLTDLNDDIFTDSFIRNKVQEMLNKELSKNILSKINHLLFEKIFLTEIKIQIPHFSVHDMVDSKRKEDGLKMLLALGNDLQGTISRLLLNVDHETLLNLQKERLFDIYFQTTHVFLDAIKDSPSPKNFDYLEKIKEQHIELYQSLIELDESDLYDEIPGIFMKFSFSYQRIMETKQKMVLKKSETKHLNDLSFLLYPEREKILGKKLKLNLLSDIGDTLFYDAQYSVIDSKNYDMAIQFSIKALNTFLARLHKRGDFCFSYFDTPIGRDIRSSRTNVCFQTPPQIRWNSEKEKYQLIFPTIHTDTKLIGPLRMYDAFTASLFFFPSIDDNGIDLHPKVSLATKNFSLIKNPPSEKVMIEALTKTLTFVHPLTLTILFKAFLEGKGEQFLQKKWNLPSVPLSEEQKLDFKIYKVEGNAETLKVFFKKL